MDINKLNGIKKKEKALELLKSICFKIKKRFRRRNFTKKEEKKKENKMKKNKA